MFADEICKNKFTRSTWHKEDNSYKYANRETKTPDTSETGR